MRELAKQGLVQLDDAAVVSRDAGGALDIRHELDRGVIGGAVGGGVLGMLLSFMFPIAGLLFGAAAGAMLGKLVDMGIDGKWVAQTAESLGPNRSALFVLVSDRSAVDPLIAALQPYRGVVRQTTLPDKLAEQLRRALE